MAKPAIIDIKGPQPGAVALQLRDLLAEALPRLNREGPALIRQGVFEEEGIYPSGIVEITEEEGGAMVLTLRGQVGTWDGARYVLEGKVEELLSLGVLPYVWGSRVEIRALADLYQSLGEIIAVWIAEYYPQAETDLTLAPGKPGDLVTTLEVPYTWGERFLTALKGYFLEARPWKTHRDALALRVLPLNHEKKGGFVCGGLWVMWEPFPDRLAVSVAKSEGYYSASRDQLLEGLLAWLRRWSAPALGDKSESIPAARDDTERKGQKPDKNAERRRQVEQLHNQGLDYQEIALRIGFSLSTVKRDARALGLVEPRK